MDSSKKTPQEKFTLKQVLRFLIPSAIGAFLFICPIPDGTGSFIIPITIFNGYINTALADVLPLIALFIIVGSAIMTLLGSVCKLSWIANNSILRRAFVMKWYWIVIKCLGAVLTLMVYFQVGPVELVGPDTGSFVFYSLICTIIAIAVYGCGLLPLLTEFGLMEFIGNLVSPLMRKLFLLPERAAVDCLSSWLGATALGVLITNDQLEKGYYTERGCQHCY